MMHTLAIQMLTICGIEELSGHRGAGVSHVLSIIDPQEPDPEVFTSFDPHHRTLLRFHDVIDPLPGHVMPRPDHVEEVLAFGRELKRDDARTQGHLLVHCHMGISRSTAAMAMLMAQASPQAAEDEIFRELHAVRPKAWPNSVMIADADRILGRDGRFVAALARHYARRTAEEPVFAEHMRRLGRGREVEMGLAVA